MKKDVTLSLAETDKEVTEFERTFWQVIYAFFEWQEMCQKKIDKKMSAQLLSVFHIMGMKDTAKTVDDISAILNAKDREFIRRKCRKLESDGYAISESVEGEMQYRLTEYGKDTLNMYLGIRNKMYISLFRDKDNPRFIRLLNKLPEVSKVLKEVCRAYDIAENTARFHSKVIS